MKLNIYEKKQVVKTYEADEYDLMWGTVEDIAEAVNLDSLKEGTNAEIIKLAGNFVSNSRGAVNNLLKDIFDGLTDEELRKAKVKDIVIVFVDVIKYTLAQVRLTGATAKN